MTSGFFPQGYWPGYWPDGYWSYRSGEAVPLEAAISTSTQASVTVNRTRYVCADVTTSLSSEMSCNRHVGVASDIGSSVTASLSAGVDRQCAAAISTVVTGTLAVYTGSAIALSADINTSTTGTVDTSASYAVAANVATDVSGVLAASLGRDKTVAASVNTELTAGLTAGKNYLLEASIDTSTTGSVVATMGRNKTVAATIDTSVTGSVALSSIKAVEATITTTFTGALKAIAYPSPCILNQYTTDGTVRVSLLRGANLLMYHSHGMLHQKIERFEPKSRPVAWHTLDNSLIMGPLACVANQVYGADIDLTTLESDRFVLFGGYVLGDFDYLDLPVVDTDELVTVLSETVATSLMLVLKRSYTLAYSFQQVIRSLVSAYAERTFESGSSSHDEREIATYEL